MKEFNLIEEPISPHIALLEASAGTGKTYALAGLVLRLLVEGKVTHIRDILVVTFTNAATEELVTRIRKRLQQAHTVFARKAEPESDDELLRHLLNVHGSGEDERQDTCKRLRESLRDFDDISISTIHKFCLVMLQGAAFETGTPFGASFIQGENNICEELARDYWRKRFYGDLLMTRLVQKNNITIRSYLAVFYMRRQFPDAKVHPETASLKECIAALTASYRKLAEEWCESSVTKMLATIKWGLRGGQPSPFYTSEWPGNVQRINHCLSASSLTDALGETEILHKLLPSVLEDDIKAKADRPAVQARLKTIPFFAAVESFFDALTTAGHALCVDFLNTMKDDLRQHKEERQILSSDDLLLRLRDGLCDPSRGKRIVAAMQKRYRAVLIDEFQDTDPVQSEIFLKAFGEANIPMYFIGDPKQAIYKFRGADIFAYLHAKEKALPNQRFSLGTNYRSASELVAAVNALFNRVPRTFIQDNIEFEPVKANEGMSPLTGDSHKMLHWRTFPPNTTANSKPACHNKDAAGLQLLCKHVADEVVRLLSSPMKINGIPIKPGDIAVLTCRNKEGEAMQAALRKVGVPIVVGKGQDVIESRVFKDLIKILQAILEHNRPVMVCTALGTWLLGYSAPDIRILIDNDQKWEALVDELRKYEDIWYRKGLIAMMERFLVKQGIRKRLLTSRDGTRHLTNMRHALEVLHSEAMERGLSPDALMAWVPEIKASASEDREETELRLETDEDAVQLLTVHKSKGLEFPIVFCPYLWEHFPNRPPEIYHPANNQKTCLAITMDKDFEHNIGLETLAEEMRLAYVALTRAKYRCYVAWGWFGRDAAQNSALGYILQAPESEEKANRNPFSVLEDVKKNIPDAEAMVRKLVGACPELISMEHRNETPVTPVWIPASAPTRSCKARRFPEPDRRFDEWRVISYSGIKHGLKTGYLPRREIEDERGEDEESVDSILTFGKGSRWRKPGNIIGTCLHTILQKADLQKVDSKENLQLIKRELTHIGVPEDEEIRNRESATITSLLATVGMMLLPGLDTALSAVPRAHQFHEWKYHHSLRETSLEDLAAAFADDQRWQAYSRSLRNSYKSSPVTGYMTGILDLLFMHNDKWYVLDWKSDDLGHDLEAYAPERLAEGIRVNHYALQYHLYTVALVRYLRTRMGEAFEYEKHIGGSYYIYLRGLGTDGSTGVYFDRPSSELIAALERLLCQEELHA